MSNGGEIIFRIALPLPNFPKLQTVIQFHFSKPQANKKFQDKQLSSLLSLYTIKISYNIMAPNDVFCRTDQAILVDLAQPTFLIPF